MEHHVSLMRHSDMLGSSPFNKSLVLFITGFNKQHNANAVSFFWLLQPPQGDSASQMVSQRAAAATAEVPGSSYK